MTNIEKIIAQRKYVKGNGLPRFAPCDGVCFSCHNQIYDGVSDKEAKDTLIVSCPLCNRSFCD